MSPEQIKELKKIIYLTAKYYGREIEPDVIAMMASDLIEFSFSDVLNAYKEYRLDKNNKFHPMPAQIIEMIQPKISPQAQGREIVDRIKEAISKFGWANSQAARALIGEVGWRAVNRNGGWSMLCESDFIFNHGRQAQMRDSLIDQFQHKDLLEGIVMPALPYSQNDALENSSDQKLIEYDHEKKKQMDEFMKKFNLNSEFEKASS